MLKNDDLELFEYCMHELRWPEVKTQLQAAVRDAAGPPRDTRCEFFLNGVLRAFGDDWSGRGFYKRFGGQCRISAISGRRQMPRSRHSLQIGPAG